MRGSVTFDTLEYMDELRRSGIEQEKAQGITKATAKAFSQMMKNKEVATKVDILDVKNDVASGISELKNDIRELEKRLYTFWAKSITWGLSIIVGLQTLFHFFGH